MGIFRYLSFFVFFGATSSALAQAIDTSLTLKTIELKAARHTAVPLSDSLEIMALAGLPAYQLLDLGTSLARLSSAHVRQYGPGGLASLSYRGGNAAQTRIYWEGFDLNGLFVGQTDLSLIPGWFFQSVQPIDATHRGSGQQFAPAGGFQLNPPPLSPQSPALRAQAQVGSYSRYTGGLQGQARHRRWGHRLGLFYDQAKNDFPYLNILGLQDRLPNAALRNLGLQGKHEYAAGPNWSLSASWWYQQATRQIPPTALQLLSLAKQDDQQLRATLGSNWFAGNWKWSWKSALLQEQLHYQDSLTQVDSQSEGQSWINRWAGSWQNSDKTHFNLQVEYAHNRARGSNYPGRLIENRWLSRFQLGQSIGQWHLQGLFSPLWVDRSVQAAAGSLRWSWQDRQGRLSWAGHFSRLRRLPTFNDRFWQEQGNPDLLPETGWGQESSLSWENTADQPNWQARMTGYHRQIDNWILWQPEGGVWRPLNLKSVRSYGLEWRLIFARQWADRWSLRLENQYSWTRSVSLEPILENDQSAGKQLIYTPVHRWNLQVQASWGKWSLGLLPALTGRVYTLADNSMSIPAYWLLDGSLLFQPNGQWKCYLQVNNLLNESYQTIISRPMPGRNFSLGLTYSISRKTK